MDAKIIFILLGVLISVVKSQYNFGPSNCLINRIDVIPCTLEFPNITKLPGPNEFGVYYTRFRQGPSGFPVCKIRPNKHKIRNITVIGGEEKIKAIYSPGFTLEPQEGYGNQIFIKYNIKCEEGELAFVDVVHFDLEEANCLDPTLNITRCVDYVQVVWGYGIAESCGMNYSQIDNLIIKGDFTIIFRSSSKNRYPGFLIWITCFNKTHYCKDDLDYVPNALEFEILDILKSKVIQDDVMQVALANENAYNPIVRAYASAIIEKYSGTEEYRIAKTYHQSRYQCNYPGEQQALIAGDNEIGDYTTRIDSGGYCWIRIRYQSVRTVPRISGLMHIYSPGYDRRRYDSNKFVEYNIKCEDGEMVYMEIEDFRLNAATCNSRCIDYVQVSGEFGILFDACGAGPPSSSYIVPADTFQVIFRSYSSFSGYFHITILCLSGKPQSYRTRGKRSSPVKTQCGDGLDNEAYHQDFMQRIKRQVGTRKIGDTLTSRRINVLYGMNVTYINNTINFINSKNGQIIPNMSIFNIETLHTYHLNGDVIDYNVSTSLRFSGPGPMFITSKHVYFQLFITNTTGVVPNATELEILKILKSDVLLDNVVLVAVANEKACNPVVRGYAESVLGMVDSTTLAVLRERSMIRLVGGAKPSEGRVEVLYRRIWGTVCDDYWDINDGNVVCKQLGYIRATKVTNGATFGQGTGSIWMDDVHCRGTERALSHCIYTRNHDCGHWEDAGVVCEEWTLPIRLVNGATPTEGRVEINVNGTWGTVCDDGWSPNDARVVCRQLGYCGYEALSYYEHNFGRGIGPIFMDNVGCLGTESSLLECSHRGGIGVYHNCSHSEDAGVRCTNVRLMGGTTSAEGRVEVCVNGIWGTVCDDIWDVINVRVVCKQLGYHGGTTAPHLYYGQGTGPIHLDDVRCRGTENSLLECSHPGIGIHNCNNHEDVGVRCSILRLVGGATSAEGRVEVNVNGTWGTVCDDLWTINNTRVVCRQLGYDEGTTAPRLYYGPGTGPIHLDNVGCLGTERSLLECSHPGVGSYNCNHYYDVGVCCSTSCSKLFPSSQWP